jgi:hypothetical protein
MSLNVRIEKLERAGEDQPCPLCANAPLAVEINEGTPPAPPQRCEGCGRLLDFVIEFDE